MAQKPEIMQRKVGLLEAVAMIVGLVIGAAIFILLPTMVGMTGPSVFLAMALACIPSIFIVLCEIQLTGTLPVTGANYVTVTRIAGASWGSIVAFGGGAGAAGKQCAHGRWFFNCMLLPSFNPLTRPLRFHPGCWPSASSCSSPVINFIGVSFAAWLQVILFLLLLVGMTIFGIAGAVNANPANMVPLFPNGPIMFMVVIVLGCVTWSGLLALADIGGDVKNPRRTLPEL